GDGRRARLGGPAGQRHRHADDVHARWPTAYRAHGPHRGPSRPGAGRLRVAGQLIEGRRSAIQVDEGYGILLVLRDDQPVTPSVEGQRRGARDAGGDAFRGLTRTDTGHRPPRHAADILGAVGRDHDSVAAWIAGLLGLEELAGAREREDAVVSGVHDDDVSVRVEVDAIRAVQR